ncbi:hypothetical protein ASD65_02655 [Microbacterium sp. Root61]|uniref:ABC transporter permease n=1 Tax=Microbacterium sp. Root61 TaxID=1736570 RepID=UPI0006F4BD9A|nr:ABC transporter permease [Microbacterium sp. Root61]KRA23437.1 hypothetical protein ASD65_02655 [Microbacterium sp. Root61]
MTALTRPAVLTPTARRRGHRRGPGLWIGVGIAAVYVLAAIGAPWLAPYDPLAQDIPAALSPPSAAHLFGTDNLGRDAFSRVLFAAQLDLFIGLTAASLAFVIGSSIGLAAGYARGWADVVLTRVMDLVQVIPGIVILIMLLLIFGAGTGGIIFALAVTGWVAYARLVRSEVFVVEGQDFVLAARLAGFSPMRVAVRHVLPNVWLQAVVYLTSDIVLAIGAVTALGYLGIGIQPPTPEWGAMIAGGQPYLQSAPWLTVIPGIVVAVLGLGLALISDNLTHRTGGRR